MARQSATIDGGTGNDVIAGDNASVLPQGNSLSKRFRTLQGGVIYGESIDGGTDGQPLVTEPARNDPQGTAVRTVVLFDHSFDPAAPGTDPEAGQYGADQIAGGPNHDVIFGQLGNDVIQGDGAIVGELPAPSDVVAGRDDDGYLWVRRPSRPRPMATTTSRAAAAPTRSSGTSDRTTSSAAAPICSASRPARSGRTASGANRPRG